jgi:uncharacterized membrane protein YdjX (TVP38/TMEM64 family)
VLALPRKALSGTVRFVAALILVAAVGVLGWRFWPLMSGAQSAILDVENMIRSWGAWGVAGSIGLMIAHSFLPFPSEIVALANGMLYGPLWGAVITWIGAMLGASAAFAAGRILGQPVLRRLLSPRGQAGLARWSRKHGGLALLVARLIPVIAFNLVNYAAALTEISWWTFLWATGLGILPLTIVLAVLGDNVLDMPPWGWALLLGAVAATWLLLHRRCGQSPPEG